MRKAPKYTQDTSLSVDARLAHMVERCAVQALIWSEWQLENLNHEVNEIAWQSELGFRNIHAQYIEGVQI